MSRMKRAGVALAYPAAWLVIFAILLVWPRLRIPHDVPVVVLPFMYLMITGMALAIGCVIVRLGCELFSWIQRGARDDAFDA